MKDRGRFVYDALPGVGNNTEEKDTPCGNKAAGRVGALCYGMSTHSANN